MSDEGVGGDGDTAEQATPTMTAGRTPDPPTEPRGQPRRRVAHAGGRSGAQSLMQAVALLPSAFQWLRTHAQQ